MSEIPKRKRRRGQFDERVMYDEETGKPKLTLTASLDDPAALDRMMERLAKLTGEREP